MASTGFKNVQHIGGIHDFYYISYSIQKNTPGFIINFCDTAASTLRDSRASDLPIGPCNRSCLRGQSSNLQQFKTNICEVMA